MIKIQFEIMFTDLTKWSETVPYDTKEEAEEEIRLFQQKGAEELTRGLYPGKYILLASCTWL